MKSYHLALPFALAVGLASPALAQSVSMPRAPALLIHGNYCGPGNNAPLPPIDALDRACAHHDACTPSGGLPSSACNARLRREAEAVSRDPRQPEDLRALAGFIAAGAALLPSDPGGDARRYAGLRAGDRAGGYSGGYAPVAGRPYSASAASRALDDND